MTNKLGFVFPGQGSQIPGMGQELYNSFPEVRNIFQIADELFGSSLSEICFSGPPDLLQKTEIAQPALLTVSTAICEILKVKNIKPDFLAGHSLGEYSALVCGGVLDFETAFRLVKLRGELMARAGEICPGTMVAVIGAEKKELEKDCLDFSEDNSVVIANYNGPRQLVISGTIDAIKRFSVFITEKGKKIIPLNVSGAFHSHLMKPALMELVEAIEGTDFNDSRVPIVTNIDSTVTREGKRFKEKLKWQLISPVLWEDSVYTMLRKEVATFVETGPQKVLSKMIKRIDKNSRVYGVEDLSSLENFLNSENLLAEV